MATLIHASLQARTKGTLHTHSRETVRGGWLRVFTRYSHRVFHRKEALVFRITPAIRQNPGQTRRPALQQLCARTLGTILHMNERPTNRRLWTATGDCSDRKPSTAAVLRVEVLVYWVVHVFDRWAGRSGVGYRNVLLCKLPVVRQGYGRDAAGMWQGCGRGVAGLRC